MAYCESVMLADASKGGIPLDVALAMPHSQRQATIEILGEIRKRQSQQDKPKGR